VSVNEYIPLQMTVLAISAVSKETHHFYSILGGASESNLSGLNL
jgi:hypothetical protein